MSAPPRSPASFARIPRPAFLAELTRVAMGAKPAPPFASKRTRLPRRWPVHRLLPSLLVCGLWLASPRAARAQSCETHVGAACGPAKPCPGELTCVLQGGRGQCQVSCERLDSSAASEPGGLSRRVVDPLLCTLGETCTEGETPQGPQHYCAPSSFSMDLNLLDSCIAHFVEGIQPDLGGSNECSVLSRLSGLLDRDANGVFNIFDVEGCIRAFLEEEPCDTATQSCPGGQRYCASDSDCGGGLFCNPELHRCERQCGLLINRGDNLVQVLERKCSGPLTTCNVERGRCESVGQCAAHSDCALGRCEAGRCTPLALCEAERDCPAGAYCLLGECQPECFRSIDCPGSEWQCTSNNRCEPLSPSAQAGQPRFVPQDYGIQFATRRVSLSPQSDRFEVPLLILNRETREQVFNQPNAVFGYRLELSYSLKQAAQCLGDLAELSAEEQADCVVSPEEEFVTLDSPFGTLYGDGDASVGVRLNPSAAESLSPGHYEATLRALFSNGASTSATLEFEQPSPSGEYGGRLSTYLGHFDEYPLGTTRLSLRLHVATESPPVQWDQLLQENGLTEDREYRDLNQGLRVTGTLHANETMLFSQPQALEAADNEIPFKGIYSEEQGRMRLIAVVDIAASDCASEFGKCDPSRQGAELQVDNAFRRKIRRILDFTGPFDAQRQVFEGVYRETVSGLFPHDVTVDGGFSLQQLTQNLEPIAARWRGPLLRDSRAVGFPDSVLAEVEADIARFCSGPEPEHFESAPAVRRYLDRFLEGRLGASGPLQNGSLQRTSAGGPIFPPDQLVSFESRIESALSALQPGATNALTLMDFFDGHIGFCGDGGDPIGCVDQEALRCGLALYRKALLESAPELGGRSAAQRGWLDLTDVPTGGPAPLPILFCKEGPGFSPDCPVDSPVPRTLVALQEHNRFYKELSQTLVYEAQSGVSDAFYTLYKGASGDPLLQGSAYAFKDAALQAAVAKYDQVRREAFSPAASAVLFHWPMASFSGQGDSWLQQLHATNGDRMEALVQLMDLRRRVTTTVGAGRRREQLFVQHVLQHEYLQQIYLAALQQHWQGSSGQYGGQAARMLALGDSLIGKVHASSNAFGLSSDRIYFENDDLNVPNWRDFANRVHGRLGRLRPKVGAAIDNLKGALSSRDAFTGALLGQGQALAASLDRLCGPPEVLPTACDLGFEDKQLESQCVGPDCLFDWRCTSEACDQVVSAFESGTEQAQSMACRSRVPSLKVLEQGAERNCTRGEVGVLLREREALDLQREQLVRRVRSLLRQIASQQQLLAETRSGNRELVAYLKGQDKELTALELSIATAESVFQTASAAAAGADCLIIVGFSNGTNCAGKAISTAAQAAAIATRFAVIPGLEGMRASLLRSKEIEFTQAADAQELRQLRLGLDNLVTNVEALVAEYEMIVRQVFNLEARVQDTLFVAQGVAAQYEQSVSDLVGKLIGRESGSLLSRNALVSEVEEEFQEVLLLLHQTLQAFKHHYNLSPEEYAELEGQALEAVTLSDVTSVLDSLEVAEQSFCARRGIADCEAWNNRFVLRYSVRDNLFPNLRDIVDPATGKVLTAGEQFHNLVTSDQFVKRRFSRGRGSTDQIELPFTLWAQDRGSKAGSARPTLLDPATCNHLLATDPLSGRGVVAVNVLGQHLAHPNGFQVRLERGSTDQIRSCVEEEGLTTLLPKVNSFTVGFRDPFFEGTPFRTSAPISACVEDQGIENVNARAGSACFGTNFLLRDRSLAAPDWKLVIPEVDDPDRMGWVRGLGTPAERRPVVNDIVLYFRYRQLDLR